jgi:hypothetical protein
VETVVEPNTDVVRRGILIRPIVKLGSRSGGVSTGKNLSQSLALPAPTTRVVSIPQMGFTNSIMATHGNRTTNQPLMNSMVVRRCRSADVVHLRGRFREPIAITTPIFYYKDGHYVRPNKVALKYPNFKKDVDLDALIKLVNFVVKANAKTSK